MRSRVYQFVRLKYARLGQRLKFTDPLPHPHPHPHPTKGKCEESPASGPVSSQHFLCDVKDELQKQTKTDTRATVPLIAGHGCDIYMRNGASNIPCLQVQKGKKGDIFIATQCSHFWLLPFGGKNEVGVHSGEGGVGGWDVVSSRKFPCQIWHDSTTLKIWFQNGSKVMLDRVLWRGWGIHLPLPPPKYIDHSNNIQSFCNVKTTEQVGLNPADPSYVLYPISHICVGISACDVPGQQQIFTCSCCKKM